MLIKNARDYEGRICDYLIADGKIRAIGTDLPPKTPGWMPARRPTC